MFERYGDHGEPLIEVHTSDGVAITPDIGHGERMRQVVAAGTGGDIRRRRIGVPDVMQAVRVLEVQDAVYELRAQPPPRLPVPFPLGSPPALLIRSPPAADRCGLLMVFATPGRDRRRSQKPARLSVTFSSGCPVR